MNANKFMTQYKRMCAAYDTCMDCPLYEDRMKCTGFPSSHDQESINKTIKTVEDWSATHPTTTRGDLLKKLFPDAPIESEGQLLICPKLVNKNFHCVPEACRECFKKYWLEEVQDER